MLKRFRSLFQRIEMHPLPLEFVMDMDETGNSVVQVYKNLNGDHILVEDLESLLNYGYQEQIESENRQAIYTLSENDQHTLLSLKSLNPIIQDNNTLLFEIEPPILSYTRSKDNVEETEAAKELQIREEPLKPTVKIDFDPEEGLGLETGYAVDDSDELVPPQEIKKTKDGKYARIGNVFAPLAEVSEKAKELLTKPISRIAVQHIPLFIQRDLVLLKKEFNAVLTGDAAEIKFVTDSVKPVVKVRKDPRGWLDFQVTYEAGGFELPHSLLSEKIDQEYIRVDENTWVAVDKKTVAQTEKELQEIDAVLTENGYRIPVTEFASLEDFIADIGGIAELDKAYREFIEQLTGFDYDEGFQLPEKLEIQLEQQDRSLRPYQRAGVHWLDWLRTNHLHGVLADDMGLGKTLQSLCMLRLAYEQTRNQQHSLIVAPKSVLHHWERELKRTYPYIRTMLYHGPRRRREVFRSSLPFVLISTYSTVSRDVDELSKVPFYFLILDEATRIKNPDARRTKAIKSLNAVHRLALSGTPVENRPTELWSMYDFLMRGHLGRHGTFVRVFEQSIMTGDQKASERLGRRIRPFILRRKKKDVAKDLPEKIEMTEWVELSYEQRQLYGGLQDQVKHIRSSLRRGEHVNYTVNILPILTKLKQICDHPALVTGKFEPILGRSDKFDLIMNKVDEIVQQGEQLAIFSHFLGMLNLFEAMMREKRINYIRIDGSTNNRQVLIDKFNQRNAKVALLSLMAAGHGINLTAANHVIHADRWWNPAVEAQATDRVHRIGQDKTVYVYRILVEGTLEERIDTLLEEKKDMADQIMSVAAGGVKKWTRDELLELLRPLD